MTYVGGLITSAVLLSLPPVPLFFWVADAEPFVGPATIKELTLVSFAALTGLAWAIWAGVVVLGAVRQKNGSWYFASLYAVAILYAVIAGGLSFFTVYCYFFFFDAGWIGY